jgi:hypothetical protein
MIFPTQKYIIEESNDGIIAAAPIIFNNDFYCKDAFPKNIFF